MGSEMCIRDSLLDAHPQMCMGRKGSVLCRSMRGLWQAFGRGSHDPSFQEATAGRPSVWLDDFLNVPPPVSLVRAMCWRVLHVNSAGSTALWPATSVSPCQGRRHDWPPQVCGDVPIA